MAKIFLALAHRRILTKEAGVLCYIAQTVLHAQRARGHHEKLELEIAKMTREQQKEQHSAALWTKIQKRRAATERRLQRKKSLARTDAAKTPQTHAAQRSRPSASTFSPEPQSCGPNTSATETPNNPLSNELRQDTACAISDRPIPSSTPKIPLNPLLPLDTAIPPVTPLFPLDTKIMGGTPLLPCVDHHIPVPFWKSLNPIPQGLKAQGARALNVGAEALTP
jgi:hypothetical protein